MTIPQNDEYYGTPKSILYRMDAPINPRIVKAVALLFCLGIALAIRYIFSVEIIVINGGAKPLEDVRVGIEGAAPCGLGTLKTSNQASCKRFAVLAERYWITFSRMNQEISCFTPVGYVSQHRKMAHTIDDANKCTVSIDF